MTLVVDGYNNDPREPVDIAAARTLLRALESAAQRGLDGEERARPSNA